MTPLGSWVMDKGIWRGTNDDSPDIIPVVEQPPGGGVFTPPAYAARSSAYGGTGALVVSWPSGHQVGYLGIIIVETSAQAVGTLPSGWTKLSGGPFTVGTAATAGSVGVEILYKFALTTAELGAGIGDSGDHQIARMITISGVRLTGNPYDVFAWDNVGTASANVTVPGLTTTIPNTLILVIVANGTDTVINQNTAPLVNSQVTFTQHASVNGENGLGGGFAIWSGIKASAGALPASTTTLVTSSKQVRLCIALAGIESGAPPPSSGLPTFHAMFGSDINLLGTYLVPDGVEGVLGTAGGSNMVSTGGLIDDLRATGASVLVRPTETNDALGAPFAFNINTWRGMFDLFYNGVVGVAGGVTKLRGAVADGTIRGLFMLDDFTAGGGVNGFSSPVTYQQLEDIAYHVKVTRGWSWMPCIYRGHLTYMRATATLNGVVRRYRYADAGWLQWRCSRGAVRTWLAEEKAAGVQCGLGYIGGANLLAGSCLKDGQSGCFNIARQDLCAMTSAEILDTGRALLAEPATHGIVWWSYGFGGQEFIATNSSVASALATIDSELQGRSDGAINIRGDLDAA